MADRRYETLLLVDPDQGDAGNTETIGRVRTLIEGQGGTIADEHGWGVREMAYYIGKQRRAYYTLLEFRATSAALSEIERNLKLMEPVMRFQSVRQPENAPPAFRPTDLQDESGGPDDGPADGEAPRRARTPAAESESRAEEDA